MTIHPFIKAMPKVELHVHLGGSIPLPTLWKLLQKYRGDGEVADLKALKEKFQFRDFLHFIELWIWKNQYIRDYDDLELIAEAVAEDFANQNIRYAEVMFTPDGLRRKGLELSGQVDSILRGFSKHKDRITLKLIQDNGRNNGAEWAMDNLKALKALSCPEVLGIGIGGPEEGYPPEPFEHVYQAARDAGLRTNAHAGEADGADSIWGAVKALKVDRIGHGTRAFEDPELLDYLKEHQIPLEMNPLSNLRTQVVSQYRDHPIKEYFSRGLKITLNTDDPKMFHNSLEMEYQMLMDHMDFTYGDIKQLLLNGVDAAWCSSYIKEDLKKEIDQYFHKAPQE